MSGELKGVDRFRGSRRMSASESKVPLRGTGCRRRGVVVQMGSDCGFGLPSVLMLVVVLSTLTFSLLLMQYFHHTAVLRDAARLKADIAAQNGVVFAAAGKSIGPDSVYFNDNTNARVYTYPWGLYRLVLSSGISGSTVSRHSALIGQRMNTLFNNALVYFNPQHQLVFAGEARVVGDVQVGHNGATLGVLEDMKSLPGFPVTGTIESEGSFDGFDFVELQMQVEIFDSLLKAAGDNGLLLTSSAPARPAGGGYDFQKMVEGAGPEIVLDRDQVFSGKMVRPGGPLKILVLGAVTFAASAIVYGPVQILSTGPITIPSNVRLEYTILYSQDSIEVLSASECKAQLISPRIAVHSNARLDYPSSIVSWVSPDSVIAWQDTVAPVEPRTLTLMENAVVEGAVVMNKRPVSLENPELIVLRQASKVIGLVYCDEEMTFDGTVIGTVVTNDFYFYESPTRYFGWIRGGVIDRSCLPEAYLTPIGVTEGNIELDILDWI